MAKSSLEIKHLGCWMYDHSIDSSIVTTCLLNHKGNCSVLEFAKEHVKKKKIRKRAPSVPKKLTIKNV